MILQVTTDLESADELETNVAMPLVVGLAPGDMVDATVRLAVFAPLASALMLP